MSIEAIALAVLVPLANHAPDHVGLAMLLYFGPVVALVAFLILLSRRGRGQDDAGGAEGEPSPEGDDDAENRSRAFSGDDGQDS